MSMCLYVSFAFTSPTCNFSAILKYSVLARYVHGMVCNTRPPPPGNLIRARAPKLPLVFLQIRYLMKFFRPLNLLVQSTTFSFGIFFIFNIKPMLTKKLKRKAKWETFYLFISPMQYCLFIYLH